MIETTLFITDSNFLEEKTKGGVQICTLEFLRLFQECSDTVLIQKVRPTKKYLNRVLIKLNLDCYDHYDYKEIFQETAKLIKDRGVTIVAINQINLAPISVFINNKYKGKVKTVLLSHGNETGDYLPFLARNKFDGIIKMLHTFRLGRHLLEEANLYSHTIDLTLCISELEMDINFWLGARDILFIPRTFSPDFLDWRPQLGRIGFVGTLSHFPNIKGLEMVLDAFSKLPGASNQEFRIVGGGKSLGEKLEQKYQFVNYLGKLGDIELKEEASTWALFLNPVFWYSRGASTKLATGINWGLPILSTIQGNRGYSWSVGEVGICKSPKDMAEYILTFSTKLEKLQEMSTLTKKVALSGESLSNLANKLLQTLTSL